MMNPESKRPVTLEDLIRLKRTERPAPEFWARFESELRAKQLAAIVEKRPWWNAMPRVLGNWKRYSLPLGATAILAVTFVSVRHYQASGGVQIQPTLPAPVEEVLASTDTAPTTSAIAASDSTASEQNANTVAATTPEPATAGIVATRTNSDVAEPGHLADVLPWVGTGQQLDADASPAPVQTLIAANLEAVKAAHPELVRKFLGREASLDADAERRPAQDPFTHLRGPAEQKRDRLLAKALPASAPGSWNGGERIARRLSEERLTEEAISRIGASGDRLSLKF